MGAGGALPCSLLLSFRKQCRCSPQSLYACLGPQLAPSFVSVAGVVLSPRWDREHLEVSGRQIKGESTGRRSLKSIESFHITEL